MQRSDPTTPQAAQCPPSAPQVAAAIFAATLGGQVTTEEIEAVDGLPPSKFPRELMVKLGFSPPEAGRGALDSHGRIPHGGDDAKEQCPAESWPPDDHRIQRAVAAGIRCGAVGEKELNLMRQQPKALWPASLWGTLGFIIVPPRPVDVLVEIVATGTVYHVAYNYHIAPADGDEMVSYEAVRVDVSDARGIGRPKLLRRVTFTREDGTMGPCAGPPDEPWEGSINRVACHARVSRVIRVDGARGTPISIGEEGISVGSDLVAWSELAEGGGKDQHGDFTAYWHCGPLGPTLTRELYVGGMRRGGERPKVLAALLEQVDFMVAYGASDRFGRSAARVVEAAGETPDVLTDLALSLPWSRARQLQGAPELTRWLEENHPQAPRPRSTTPRPDRKLVALARDGQAAGSGGAGPLKSPAVRMLHPHAAEYSSSTTASEPPALASRWQVGDQPPDQAPSPVRASSPTRSLHLEHPISRFEDLIGMGNAWPPEADKIDWREVTRVPPKDWPESLRTAMKDYWKDRKGQPLPMHVPMCDLTGQPNYPERL